MFAYALSKRGVASALVILVGTVGLVRADSAQNKFYRAYYVERVDGDWAVAAKLYAEVADDRKAGQELRSRAEAQLAACREELASRDFAKLMPPQALFYAEINRPGDQILKLLTGLGLVAEEGGTVPAEGRRVAISPALVKELIGIGGAAASITAFDPVRQIPSGVLIFHPGNLEVIRGLIETGLPIGAETVDSLGGFPTYLVEGQAYVTLTSRLVIVGTQPGQIEAVLDRLSGKEKSSLATNPAMADLMEGKDDALLTFFVNAKPILPMLKGALAAGAAHDSEVALAQAVLDIDSLHSLTGRLSMGEGGISMDIGLRLDEGHQNLVYNFLRTPAINPATLKCIPFGAAGALVGALSEASSQYSGGSPIVTALDLGREIFANITSFAIFALPPTGTPAQGGPPIPDLGVAITVNDPDKSEALWTQMLALGSLASGAAVQQGSSTDVEGVRVRRYQFPDNVTIYYATSGSDVLIATSKSAIAGSIRAKRKGESILEDEAFAGSLSRLTSASTKALFLHAGRCAAIARQFMSPHEAQEAAPFMSVLSDTVASLVVNHSGEQFRLSVALTGIPDVGDLVGKIVTQEVRGHQSGAHLARVTN